MRNADLAVNLPFTGVVELSAWLEQLRGASLPSLESTLTVAVRILARLYPADERTFRVPGNLKVLEYDFC